MFRITDRKGYEGANFYSFLLGLQYLLTTERNVGSWIDGHRMESRDHHVFVSLLRQWTWGWKSLPCPDDSFDLSPDTDYSTYSA